MKLTRFLAGPVLLWFLVFVLIPLILVFIVSFTSRDVYGGIAWDFQFANYTRTFSTNYLKILWESLKLATLTTVLCLALGVLISWAMVTTSRSWRSFYLLAVSLPFLTNLVIRIYAIRFFVGYDGPLQNLLTLLKIPFDPFAFSQNEFLVGYGMVTTYLPFMVLPLYAAFEKFDFTLVEAAQDLGAGSGTILWQVILPGLRRALLSGALLVFIPALGEYVIPDLLGGAKTMLYGNLITQEFLKSRDWPFGSALSMVLILILAVIAVGLLQKSQEAPHA